MNKLKWDSDGSNLDSWADTDHGIKGDAVCLRYRDDEMNGHPCDRRYYYICEFLCPSSTTTKFVLGACQPLVGYTLNPSVDKYYKPVKNSVTWQAARDACTSDGTKLVELRTKADYQAIRPIYGKNMF